MCVPLMVPFLLTNHPIFALRAKMIDQYYNNAKNAMQAHIDRYRAEIIQELAIMMTYQEATKDILIVIHNQLDFLQNCIKSINKHTKNFRLYLYNNASNDETTDYLQKLESDFVRVIHSDENLGFILPNNQLASLTSGDYLITLNSDTQVFDGWDRAMIAYLQQNPDCAQVGYQGGLLDEKGFGGRAVWGSDIDYVAGFCSCISRNTYEKYGLFDTTYQFAYCEDADFSLRLKSQGHRIYALHLLFLHHFENQTIKQVVKDHEIKVTNSFNQNHQVLRDRWANYLSNHRVELIKGTS